MLSSLDVMYSPEMDVGLRRVGENEDISLDPDLQFDTGMTTIY